MLVTHNDGARAAEQQFGAQVKDARDARGWSQEALARHLKETLGIELHQTGIARLERGERAIRLNEASALAKLLGLDLQQYGGIGPRLTEEEYSEALEHVEKIRKFEAGARDKLEHLRRTREDALARAERDLATWRDERVRLEAAIQEYEARQRG